MKKTQNVSLAQTARKRTKKKKFNNPELFGLVIPGMILTFIFAYLPMFGLIIAFKDYKYSKGIFGSRWIGLDNFKYLFSSNTAGILFRNTIGYSLLFLLAGMLVAVLLALCLDLMTKKASIKIYQGSMFLPFFFSWVIVSFISHALLSYDNGIINAVLEHFGQNRISFYSEPKYWPFIFLFFNVWKSMGYNSLIYYGTILGIDQELYEAVKIDGGGYFVGLRYITLPHLKHTMLILGIMGIGGIFKSDYGMFFYLPKDSGALYSVTDTLDTYIMRALRSAGSIGGASAAGFFQSIVGFVTVIIANGIVKKIDNESSLF